MYDLYGRDGVSNSQQDGRFDRHHERHGFDIQPDLNDFGFPHFVFRDPQDVFREFFGGKDPFEELLDRKQGLNICPRHGRGGGNLPYTEKTGDHKLMPKRNKISLQRNRQCEVFETTLQRSAS